jgi:phenylpropionate dioxygenase-like ring-hydroxylating dioxygenase large terminal subunit
MSNFGADWCLVIPYLYTTSMRSQDYTQGDTFQVEKRTLFSTQWLPLCAEGQVARPGDFLSATVGGWGVFGVRDKEGAVRVLRNACRHQNMQVVGTPSGNCETFRCRFHGWTYDLQGTFLGAPPPVAPKDPASPELHLASLATSIASGIVFFSLATPPRPPDLGGSLPAYGGTLTTEIACNWKVCVEHLLAEHTPSADFGWHWPLLAVRRAGAVAIMEQVVPHTFLRTRLLTHVFGGAPDDHKQPAATISHVCERLQADRNDGKPAAEGALVATFHRQLAEAYAQDRATT